MPGDAESTVREMFRAFDESGDLDKALSFFDPAVEWTDQVVTKQVVHGHDGFREAMARLAAEGYTVESSPERFEELGDDTVLAAGYTRLVQDERDSFIDLPAIWAFVVRDGKIVRGSSASKRDEALAAIAGA